MMKDALGREIQKGDFIVWAGYFYSSGQEYTEIRSGIVTKIVDGCVWAKVDTSYANTDNTIQDVIRSSKSILIVQGYAMHEIEAVRKNDEKVNQELKNALHELSYHIYPAIASRVIILEEAGETNAMEHWNKTAKKCMKVINLINRVVGE